MCQKQDALVAAAMFCFVDMSLSCGFDWACAGGARLGEVYTHYSLPYPVSFFNPSFPGRKIMFLNTEIRAYPRDGNQDIMHKKKPKNPNKTTGKRRYLKNTITTTTPKSM